MTASPDAASENLLPNGDFENGLAGWEVDAAQAEWEKTAAGARLQIKADERKDFRNRAAMCNEFDL